MRCVPKDKFDTAAIANAHALAPKDLAPILSELLEWVKDMNWPVAPATAEFLSNAGPEIVPHVAAILSSNDSTWKYGVLASVVSHQDALVREMLKMELVRLAKDPTEAERLEEVDRVARGVLRL